MPEQVKEHFTFNTKIYVSCNSLWKRQPFGNYAQLNALHQKVKLNDVPIAECRSVLHIGHVTEGSVNQYI